ncbi:nitroreductase family protein [archaeon]|nr:nitroreductase family protein [archaeon]
MQLTEAIKTRQSIKKFSDKKADWRKIVQAIDSARYTPMAGNNFSLKFILVRNVEKIEKLKAACQQDFVKTPYVIVVVSDYNKVKKLYGKNGETFGKQQAGAAINNILLTLTNFGLDSCWVGYFSEKLVKSALKISDNFTVEALIPVGYRHKGYSHKIALKTELENILFFDSWKNKKMSEEFRVSDLPTE